MNFTLCYDAVMKTACAFPQMSIFHSRSLSLFSVAANGLNEGQHSSQFLPESLAPSVLLSYNQRQRESGAAII